MQAILRSCLGPGILDDPQARGRAGGLEPRRRSVRTTRIRVQRRCAMRRTLTLVSVTFVVLAGLRGEDDSGTSGIGSSPEAEGGPAISLATTDFGNVLVDQDG